MYCVYYYALCAHYYCTQTANTTTYKPCTPVANRFWNLTADAKGVTPGTAVPIKVYIYINILYIYILYVTNIYSIYNNTIVNTLSCTHSCVHTHTHCTECSTYSGSTACMQLSICIDTIYHSMVCSSAIKLHCMHASTHMYTVCYQSYRVICAEFF
jgi:hypothetical protein